MQMNEVWSSTLDGRFKCAVVSKSDPYQGKLIIKDGDSQIHIEDVMIANGAPYGPDVDDVSRWEQRCINIIESRAV